MLGLRARIGGPARPAGPSVACRVRLKGDEALVQVGSSDARGGSGFPSASSRLPVKSENGKVEAAKFADSLAEGLLNRLVRMQLLKGPRREGQVDLRFRIENASPLLLNGVAALGTESGKDEVPASSRGSASRRVGASASPRAKRP